MRENFDELQIVEAPGVVEIGMDGHSMLIADLAHYQQVIHDYNEDGAVNPFTKEHYRQEEFLACRGLEIDTGEFDLEVRVQAMELAYDGLSAVEELGRVYLRCPSGRLSVIDGALLWAVRGPDADTVKYAEVYGLPQGTLECRLTVFARRYQAWETGKSWNAPPAKVGERIRIERTQYGLGVQYRRVDTADPRNDGPIPNAFDAIMRLYDIYGD